jgi:alanine racemase
MSASSQALRCRAEIDLAALERNLRLIRASLPPQMRYVAVVKTIPWETLTSVTKRVPRIYKTALGT